MVNLKYTDTYCTYRMPSVILVIYGSCFIFEVRLQNVSLVGIHKLTSLFARSRLGL